jgi:hypothetical protein
MSIDDREYFKILDRLSKLESQMRHLLAAVEIAAKAGKAPQAKGEDQKP